MHATSFEDLLLSAPLTRAISDRGFEHPSEGMLTSFNLREGRIYNNQKKNKQNTFLFFFF